MLGLNGVMHFYVFTFNLLWSLKGITYLPHFIPQKHASKSMQLIPSMTFKPYQIQTFDFFALKKDIKLVARNHQKPCEINDE
jgi:hypothetical protein